MRIRLSEIREGLSGLEQFVLVVVALSPVASAPVFLFAATPRVALALCLLPLGAVVLAHDAKHGDRAAILAVTFLAVACISSLLSPARMNSLIGTPDWWIGTLGLTTGLAWWALGRVLGRRARELLVPALAVGALWNATIALAQVAMDIDTGILATIPGRGSGTMLNPTYYGAFMSGILACWLMRVGGTWRSHTVTFALATGVGLSGGRIASAVVLVVAAAGLLVGHQRLAAMKNMAATVGGLAIASVIATEIATSTEALGLAARASTARGGGVRFAIWHMAIRAWADRPWLGWGPANIELATERQFDLDYTRAHTLENGTLLRWLDVHNVVLNLLVAVGAIGVLVAVLIVAASLRGWRQMVQSRVDLPLFAGAAAMAANWMLEPWTIHTVMIGLLLFGAATHRSRNVSSAEGPISTGTATRVVRLAGASGLALAVLFLGNLFVLDRYIEDGEFARAADVARLGYRDPWVYRSLSDAYWLSILERDREQMLQNARSFAQRSADGYPSHDALSRVGSIAFAEGDTEGSLAAELRALEVQPWNPTSHRRVLVLAQEVGDDALYQASMDVLCGLGADACDRSVGLPDAQEPEAND